MDFVQGTDHKQTTNRPQNCGQRRSPGRDSDQVTWPVSRDFAPLTSDNAVPGPAFGTLRPRVQIPPSRRTAGLVRRFSRAPDPFRSVHPASHRGTTVGMPEALVALGLPLIFTTNYDELFEDAHVEAAVPVRVSADEAEFKAHVTQRPDHHLGGC